MGVGGVGVVLALVGDGAGLGDGLQHVVVVGVRLGLLLGWLFLCLCVFGCYILMRFGGILRLNFETGFWAAPL